MKETASGPGPPPRRTIKNEESDLLTDLIGQLAVQTRQDHFVNSVVPFPDIKTTGYVSKPYVKLIVWHGRTIPIHDESCPHEYDNDRLYREVQSAKEWYKHRGAQEDITDSSANDIYDDERDGLDNDDGDEDRDEDDVVDKAAADVFDPRVLFNLKNDLQNPALDALADSKPAAPAVNEASSQHKFHHLPSGNVAGSQGQLEDMLSQRVLEQKRMDPDEFQPSGVKPNIGPVMFQGRYHYPLTPKTSTPTSKKGPLLVVVCRTSGPVDLAYWNYLHLGNLIVGNDFVPARHAAEHNDPNLAITPFPATIHSLVYVNQRSYQPIALFHSINNTYAQMRFIQLLDQAQAEGREVMLLVRGMSGHSTFPNVYGSVLNRWPGLVIRVAYALRKEFINNANCCLPPMQPPRPFTLHVTPPTLRGISYSRLVNLHDLDDDYRGVQLEPSATRINEWHWEECAARILAMMWPFAIVVLFIRGQYRNRIIA